MLTFEKVLKVFQAYLDDDPLYEVVQTSHGYTLMAWEPHRNDWYSADIQKTPDDLRNALLGTYANFLEDKITGNDCDLTVTETEKSSRGVGDFGKSAGKLDTETPEGGRDYASSFCFAVCSILSAPSMACLLYTSIPELLDMVDNKTVSFNPAVELSYLSPEQQQEVIRAT